MRKLHEKLRQDRSRKSEDNAGAGGESKRGMIKSDSKNIKVTFANIEKMHYSDFNSGNGKGDDDFRPSDIVDDDEDNASEDEILKRFKKDASPKSKRDKKSIKNQN